MLDRIQGLEKVAKIRLIIFIVFSVKYIKDSNKMFRVVDSLLEEEIKKSKRSKKNG